MLSQPHEHHDQASMGSISDQKGLSAHPFLGWLNQLQRWPLSQQAVSSARRPISAIATVWEDTKRDFRPAGWETAGDGGSTMIFRRENHGDAFQQPISNLRKQLQGDEAVPTDPRRYPDTSEPLGAGDVAAAREDTYAPSRVADEPAAPSISGTVASPVYRAASWQNADATTSVIAANAHWNGTLRSEGSLHIHGRADGELHATNDVFVAEGAEVDAELFADSVVVAGTVRGRIEARSRLEVLPQGHVAGDVKAPKLVVHEGARLTGQLKMENGSSDQPYSSSVATPKARRGSSQ